jgi:methylmalonyl-CoA/ethylmalonyl-CoA epimerase
MGFKAEIAEGGVCQIGTVVRDIEKAVENYYRDFNIGPWYFWDFKKPDFTDLYFRGKHVERYEFIIALALVGNLQYELIQPTFGTGTHTEFLEKKGEGLHHFKLYYKDIDKTLYDFKKKGIGILQSGRYGDDVHFYLDTEDTYGVIIEIGNNGDIGPHLKKYPE